ncbi:trypsin-like serine protease [Streptomyces sp. DG2A-72]|uniref:trypsin-like serine peptidase n=1 Tax=Streptomyces sp. DG2A-72 TaxID=3051386 RepID=UPI00265BA47F|nr:trypsin-like peptidase domain-containing protein [Streptomyces sp. DG2A-72]MDO0938955.1 trypsin-like serine protease [Streptomyces sp. DG2A-72]
MRAAAANPADMPGLKKRPSATADDAAEDTAPAVDSAHASAPSAKPVNSTFATTAAAASEISVSQEVPYTTAPQYSLVGRLFYREPDGSGHSCSAAVIVSNNRNTLWTAGHCVHMGDGTGDAGWNDMLQFIPGYRDGSGPYGAWTIKSKVVNNEWMSSADFEDADYAAVVLNDHPTWGKLQDNVGAFGYTFTENLTDHPEVYAAGYPGEGYNRTDLNAERMMYCYGDTVDAGPWNPLDDRMSMDCDMGKGASGGPMIEGKNTSDPRIIGAISHYVTDDAGDRNSDDLFSSEHDSKAANTMSAANGIS